MRRVTAAVSVALLAVAAIAVAEATLLALLFVFSAILNIDLTVLVGGRSVQARSFRYGLLVTIENAGVIASIVFITACGVTGGLRQFMRWRVEP